MKSAGLRAVLLAGWLLAATPASAAVAAPPPPPVAEGLTWQAFDAGLPSDGQWREGFAIADFDGDGHPDLASGPPRRAGVARPAIFLGDGQGSWREWLQARFPEIRYDYGDAASGDFDGDGRRDLVLGMHLEGIAVLLGDGRGGFRLGGQGIERGGPPSFSSVALAAVDWDGDGLEDLLALGEGPALGGAGARQDSRGLRWYRHLGEGVWRGHDLLSGDAAGVFGRSLALADVDGDGSLEVALGSRRLGERRLVLDRSADGALAARQVEALPRRALIETVAAGELDDSPGADLAFGFRRNAGDGWESGVAVLLGSLTRSALLLRQPGAGGVLALAIGDVDGDGADDLAAGGGEGRLWIFRRRPDGGFVRDRAPHLDAAHAACRVSAIELADLDGDGRSELIAGLAGETEGCAGGGALRAWRSGPRLPALDAVDSPGRFP